MNAKQHEESLKHRGVSGSLFRFAWCHRGDLLLSLFLGLGMCGFYFLGSLHIDSAILRYQSGDAWFTSDAPRVVENMCYRYRSHYRTNVHPLFPLVAYPPTKILHRCGMNTETVVRLMAAIWGGIWVGLMYVIFRGMRLQRVEAFVFALLSAFSTAGLLWNNVPETYQDFSSLI